MKQPFFPRNLEKVSGFAKIRKRTHERTGNKGEKGGMNRREDTSARMAQYRIRAEPKSEGSRKYVQLEI